MEFATMFNQCERQCPASLVERSGPASAQGHWPPYSLLRCARTGGCRLLFDVSVMLCLMGWRAAAMHCLVVALAMMCGVLRDVRCMNLLGRRLHIGSGLLWRR